MRCFGPFRFSTVDLDLAEVFGIHFEYRNELEAGSQDAPTHDFKVHLLSCRWVFRNRSYVIVLDLWGCGRDMGKCTDETF